MLRRPIDLIPQHWLTARLALGSVCGVLVAVAVFVALSTIPVGEVPASPREPLNTVTGLWLAAGVPALAILGAYWTLLAGTSLRQKA